MNRLFSGEWGGPEGPPRSPGGQSNISSLRIEDGLTSVLEGLRRPAILVRMTPGVGRLVAARAGSRRGALQRVVELVLPDWLVPVPSRSHRRRAWSPRPSPGRGSRRSLRHGRPRSRFSIPRIGRVVQVVRLARTSSAVRMARPEATRVLLRPMGRGEPTASAGCRRVGVPQWRQFARVAAFGRPGIDAAGPIDHVRGQAFASRVDGVQHGLELVRLADQCRRTLRTRRHPSGCGCSGPKKPSCGR